MHWAVAAVALGFDSHLWPLSFPLSLTPVSTHSSPVLSDKCVKMQKKKKKYHCSSHCAKGHQACHDRAALACGLHLWPVL